MDTKFLVKQAKEGEKEALVKLIMEQKEDYYKLAYIYMKNNEDAMDAMQDMIVILYENIHRLKDDSAFYSWSKTILVNCCKTNLRKKKKLILLDEVEEQYYDGDFEGKENELLLEEHLCNLSLKHQEVIKLRYYLDLDYETIASLLKIPVGTVKSRINIGMKKLKRSMGGELGE